jgi:uncharacterized protein (DUF433 family)
MKLDGIKLSVLSKHGAYARYEAGTIYWTECDVIERDPGRMRGAWRFKGTGVPLANLFRALATGSSATEFVRANDGVKDTAPATALKFLAEQLDDAKEALWQYGGPRTATPPLLDGGKHNRDAEHDPETTHWKDCDAVSRDAERMTGSWVIGHLRFPLSTLFTNLACTGNVKEFFDDFSVTIDETLPVLQFLADDLDTLPHTVQPARSETSTQAPRIPGGQD